MKTTPTLLLTRLLAVGRVREEPLTSSSLLLGLAQMAPSAAALLSESALVAAGPLASQLAEQGAAVPARAEVARLQAVGNWSLGSLAQGASWQLASHPPDTSSLQELEPDKQECVLPIN